MSPRPPAGPQRVLQRRRENLDILLGVVGFFTAVVLVSTVVAEVRGEPSLLRALLLAVLLALCWLTWRMRQDLQRRLTQGGSPPRSR
jgi:threonine/homoserine/homoserine lactone efflux protein